MERCGRARLYLLKPDERRNVVPQLREILIAASIELSERKSCTIVAGVPAPVLEAKVQVGDRSKVSLGVYFLVSHAVAPGVNHANRRQKGVNILQGRIEKHGHRPIAIGTLVDVIVESFIVTSLDYVIGAIRHVSCQRPVG